MPNPIAGSGDGTSEVSASDLEILNQPDDSSTEEGDEAPEIDTGDESEDEEETSEESDEESSEESEDDEEPSEEDEEEVDEDESSEEDETEDEEDEEGEEGSLYKQVKKLAPELLKKVPGLKDALVREEQFTQHFESPEDAKNGKEALEYFGQIEKDLLSAQPENLFKAIHKTDEQAFAKLAFSVLPAIRGISKDLYGEVLGQPIKQVLRLAFNDGRSSNNKNLWGSAVHLHKFLFNDMQLDKDFEPSVEGLKEKEETPEVKKMKDELEARDRRLYETFKSDVVQLKDYKVRKSIESTLSDLKLDKYRLKNLTSDISREIDKMLSSDARYMSSINSLWKQAHSAGFPSDWKAKIANHYAARAKAVLPVARKKVLRDAEIEVKGKVGKQKEKTRIVPSSSNARRDITQVKPKDIDWTKTSDADILSDDMSRVKFKKRG